MKRETLFVISMMLTGFFGFIIGYANGITFDTTAKTILYALLIIWTGALLYVSLKLLMKAEES